MNIPNYVLNTLKVLNNNGFETYLVGGCVRDYKLGKEPKDYDIATNSLPDNSVNLFKKAGFNVIETGLKHGTITVGIHGSNEYCEVTTYRIDGEYKNNRSPENVIFTNNIISDLSRRDFTINAMAYNPLTGEFVDPFNGLEDLNNKIIRAVGNPKERFNEDALRIMRAARFASILDFNIDKDTKIAMLLNLNLLTSISIERRRDEFIKTILSGKKNVLIDLKNLDILHFVIPEIEVLYNFEQFNPWHKYDVFYHTVEVVNNVPNELVVKLAAIFHDIGKPYKFFKDENGVGHFYGHPEKSAEIAEKILKRLRFDNDTINKVILLIKYHDYPIDTTKALSPEGKATSIRKAKKILNLLNCDEKLAMDLVNLKIADNKGQNLDNPKVVSSLNGMYAFKDIMKEVIDKGETPRLNRLKINGRDLLKIGFKGKEIGTELKRLLELVMEDENLNNNEKLMSIAQNDWEVIVHNG